MGDTMAHKLAALSGLHDKIADDVPKIKRGLVRCLECGRVRKVDGADCLRHGWPECCGYTMTIDMPGDSHA